MDFANQRLETGYEPFHVDVWGPVLRLTSGAIYTKFFTDSSAFKGIPTILLATLLSILVAHLTHKYIEVGLTRTLKNKFMPSKQSDQVTRADLAS